MGGGEVEKKRERESKRESTRACVCVRESVCVCVRKLASERASE